MYIHVAFFFENDFFGGDLHLYGYVAEYFQVYSYLHFISICFLTGVSDSVQAVCYENELQDAHA